MRAERQDVAAIHEELARRYLTLLDRQEIAPNPWDSSTDQQAALPRRFLRSSRLHFNRFAKQNSHLS